MVIKTDIGINEEFIIKKIKLTKMKPREKLLLYLKELNYFFIKRNLIEENNPIKMDLSLINFHDWTINFSSSHFSKIIIDEIIALKHFVLKEDLYSNILLLDSKFNSLFTKRIRKQFIINIIKNLNDKSLLNENYYLFEEEFNKYFNRNDLFVNKSGSFMKNWVFFQEKLNMQQTIIFFMFFGVSNWNINETKKEDFFYSLILKIGTIFIFKKNNKQIEEIAPIINEEIIKNVFFEIIEFSNFEGDKIFKIRKDFFPEKYNKNYFLLSFKKKVVEEKGLFSLIHVDELYESYKNDPYFDYEKYNKRILLNKLTVSSFLAFSNKDNYKILLFPENKVKETNYSMSKYIQKLILEEMKLRELNVVNFEEIMEKVKMSIRVDENSRHKQFFLEYFGKDIFENKKLIDNFAYIIYTLSIKAHLWKGDILSSFRYPYIYKTTENFKVTKDLFKYVLLSVSDEGTNLALTIDIIDKIKNKIKCESHWVTQNLYKLEKENFFEIVKINSKNNYKWSK